MHQRRFVLFIIAVFFMCALPFFLVQSSGTASAGLSAGFVAPIGSGWHLLLFFMLGVTAALLPREGLLLVPLACVAMTLAGAGALLAAQQPAMMQFLLAGVLCFGISCGLVRFKITLLSVLISGSIGFHMGLYYLSMVPTIASSLFFLLGVMVCMAMALAISVAFGITLIGDHAQFWDRFKESPRFEALRDFLR
jgi:hypothetical protein